MILYFCNFSPIFFTGYFKGDSMVQTMAKLRTIKVNSNDERITPMTELAFIPRKTNGQYPGLFIFTGASRYIIHIFFNLDKVLFIYFVFEMVNIIIFQNDETSFEFGNE